MKSDGETLSFDVTVIIPTFNRPELIRETIDSVLAQTVPAKQILVVDNGPDGQAYRDMIDAYQGQVSYLRNDPPGTLAARSAGLAQATTEWVAFLDDDDLWKPRFLEVARRATTNPEVSYIGADHIKFEGTVRQPSTNFDRAPKHYWDNIARPEAGEIHSFVGRFPVERLLKRIPFYPSSAIIKRELVMAAGGFDLRMTGYVTEDIEFLIRALSIANVAIIWEPMMEYRLHRGSYSRGDDRQEIGRWKVFEFARAHHQALEPAFLQALDKDLPGRRERIFSVAYSAGDYESLAEVARLLPRSAWTLRRRLRAALAKLPRPLADTARRAVNRLSA